MTGEKRDWRGDEWEKWGQADPYFGVVSHPDLRAGGISESARDKFFRGGETEIAETLTHVRRLVGRDFRPKRTLDFGCGVGRLTIPLARESQAVVAVDVSPSMLDEARRNCQHAGVSNVSFQLSEPGLRGVDGPFDFVQSSIVFQHIPPRLGYGLFEAILNRLSPDGVGMVHFTYGRRSPLLSRVAHGARRSSRVVHRLLNLVQRRPFGAPLMAMFEYDLGRILETLERRGLNRVDGRLTDHGGCLGVMLAFARLVS
jgi:SAM-dependent methyltransferase